MLNAFMKWLDEFWESPQDRQRRAMAEDLRAIRSCLQELLIAQLMHARTAEEQLKANRETFGDLKEIIRRLQQTGPHL